MPSFNASNGAFTPATNQDNYTLDMQTAGVFARATMVSWGGSATTSTGYRTRWTRPSTVGSGAFTAITLAANNPNYASAGARFGTFATAPVLTADPGANLFATDWNAQGGEGLLVLPLAQPWWFVFGSATQQLSCRNAKGTDASLSSYGLTWEED